MMLQLSLNELYVFFSIQVLAVHIGAFRKWLS